MDFEDSLIRITSLAQRLRFIASERHDLSDVLETKEEVQHYEISLI